MTRLPLIYFITTIITLHQVNAASDCDLKSIFRTPSRRNYDQMEILERSNFDNDDQATPTSSNVENPKSFANAQVMLRFGGVGKEEGRKCACGDVCQCRCPPPLHPYCYPGIPPIHHPQCFCMPQYHLPPYHPYYPPPVCPLHHAQIVPQPQSVIEKKPQILSPYPTPSPSPQIVPLSPYPTPPPSPQIVPLSPYPTPPPSPQIVPLSPYPTPPPSPQIDDHSQNNQESVVQNTNLINQGPQVVNENLVQQNVEIKNNNHPQHHLPPYHSYYPYPPVCPFHHAQTVPQPIVDTPQSVTEKKPQILPTPPSPPTPQIHDHSQNNQVSVVQNTNVVNQGPQVVNENVVQQNVEIKNNNHPQILGPVKFPENAIQEQPKLPLTNDQIEEDIRKLESEEIAVPRTEIINKIEPTVITPNVKFIDVDLDEIPIGGGENDRNDLDDSLMPYIISNHGELQRKLLVTYPIFNRPRVEATRPLLPRITEEVRQPCVSGYKISSASAYYSDPRKIVVYKKPPVLSILCPPRLPPPPQKEYYVCFPLRTIRPQPHPTDCSCCGCAKYVGELNEKAV